MTDTTAGEGDLIGWFSQYIDRYVEEQNGPDTDALIACLDRVRDSYRLAAQPSAGAQGEAVAKIAAALVSIDRIFPVHVTETPDYAELAFNECGAKAMTVEPDTWTALNTLGDDLRSLLALYATPAQPDTGDVAALLALFGDDAELMVVERSAPSLEISTHSLRSEILAALSKPNAQGREG